MQLLCKDLVDYFFKKIEQCYTITDEYFNNLVTVGVTV